MGEHNMEGDLRDDSVNEVDLHASIKRHVQGSCDICLDSVHGAVKHCQTCSTSLCQSHLAEHNQAPATSAHVLAHPARTPRVPAAAAPPPAVAPVNAGVSWSWLLVMVLAALVAAIIPNYVNRDAVQPIPVELMSESEASDLRACCQRVHLSAEDQKRSMAELMCHLQGNLQEKKRALHAHVQQQRRAAEEACLDAAVAPYRDVVMTIVERSHSAVLAHLDTMKNDIEGDLDWCSEVPSALELPSATYAA
ncbi:uncharacterized protein LOC121719594 isoform X1 [Alosa sapidissima]|uniref:uncharacterized protein LOC121719594 isoform X1 n=2 Tax=Alosa sapidissima TaxID=34773 RepID=UPI001C0A247F|nr:uncharacterized protein LOC121719594 isoform X1 [Alosa sapidissima]